MDKRRAWRDALLPDDSVIKDAIRNLDETALQIALVVSGDNVLLGTVTDGDIRRGLLRGLDVESPLDTIVHRDAFVVTPEVSRDMALHLMRANGYMHLPVVDRKHRVVGLHLLKELSAVPRRNNLIVVMAGGRGKRLMPHTSECPKPLLPIAGKPMLERIIEHARAEGFHRFSLAVHYLGEMIENYFGDGEAWQVRINYLREKSPLGTAGALGLLEPKPELPIIVSNGDVLTDIRYAELLEFHSRHGAAATMAVRVHEWQHPFGVVMIDGVEIVAFDEKPVNRTYINAGVYVLEPFVLDELRDSEVCDMPALFERIRARGYTTVAYPMHEPWLDVGRPDDYSKATSEYM